MASRYEFYSQHLLPLFLLLLSLCQLICAELVGRLESSPGTSIYGTGVTYTVTNTGANSESFRYWNTPFDVIEGILVNNPFSVIKSDDENQMEIAFRGIRAKRGDVDSSSSEITVQPGKSVYTDVDLMESYAFEEIGSYYVFLQNPSNISPEIVETEIIITVQPPILPMQASSIGAASQEGFCAPNEFVGCSNSQITEVSQAYVDLSTEIPRIPCWENDNPGDVISDSYFGDDGLNMGEVRAAFHNIVDIACQQNDFTFGTKVNCDCDYEGYYAYVYSTDVQHQIFLCPRFWESNALGYDSKMGTIIHEISHYVDVMDTDDLGYGCGFVLNVAMTDASQARINAENFGFYVEKGCDISTEPPSEPPTEPPSEPSTDAPVIPIDRETSSPTEVLTVPPTESPPTSAASGVSTDGCSCTGSSSCGSIMLEHVCNYKSQCIWTCDVPPPSTHPPSQNNACCTGSSMCTNIEREYSCNSRRRCSWSCAGEDDSSSSLVRGDIDVGGADADVDTVEVGNGGNEVGNGGVNADVGVGNGGNELGSSGDSDRDVGNSGNELDGDAGADHDVGLHAGNGGNGLDVGGVDHDVGRTVAS